MDYPARSAQIVEPASAPLGWTVRQQKGPKVTTSSIYWYRVYLSTYKEFPYTCLGYTYLRR